MKRRLACLGMILFLTFASTASAICTLMLGNKGKEVTEVQTYLHRLGYLRERPTGYFGRQTQEAVKSFQLEYELDADGVVGPLTYSAIHDALAYRKRFLEYKVEEEETLNGIAVQYGTSAATIIAVNNLPDGEVVPGQTILVPVGKRFSQPVSRGRTGGVQAVPWSIVDKLWRRGEDAYITDIDSGSVFCVQRFGGHYHADVEPLTWEDTRTFFGIYSNRWSWDRRAVVVHVKGLSVAASVNGMPHGRASISENGFPGHFCVHFLGSRIHRSGRVDMSHQEMVMRALHTGLE